MRKKNGAELLLMGANPMSISAKEKRMAKYLSQKAEILDRLHGGRGYPVPDAADRKHFEYLLRKTDERIERLQRQRTNPTKLEKQRTTRERAERIRGARLNNPLMNANFTTAQKMELGRLGISWTAIQTAADVRRAKKALADANKIRRRFGNPMAQTEQRAAAAEIYTGFHHEAPAESIVLDEPHIPAGTYPELGLLISIKFKPTNRDAVDQYERAFVVPREDVHVIGDLERDQIYFAGGDQHFSSDVLRKLGWDGRSVNFEVGEAREIVYLARKYHDEVQPGARGELVEWVHPFGEENGKKPRLWYDVAVRRIYLRGGEYQIRDEGITN